MKKLALALLATAVVFSVTAIAPVQAAKLVADQGLSVFEKSAAPASNLIVEKRRKPRIKGGSGCDDPEDVLEHPECR